MFSLDGGSKSIGTLKEQLSLKGLNVSEESCKDILQHKDGKLHEIALSVNTNNNQEQILTYKYIVQDGVLDFYIYEPKTGNFFKADLLNK